MSYLIDTNVISELVKSNPNKNVIEWFGSIPDKELYLSVITFGEIRKGIDKISDYAKKEKIKIWLDHELTEWFSDRILGIDRLVANKWGLIQSNSIRTLPAIDSLIAATAIHYDLSIVTRNGKDFDIPGLETINPFI
jgi:predicted nucleic acid-binding protein